MGRAPWTHPFSRENPVTRTLFLPLSIAGLSSDTQADPEVAMLARWLPEVSSRMASLHQLATAYARMVGRNQEGHPVLLTFSQPVAEDQARALGKQHGAQFVVTGTIEENEETTVRTQLLDVDSGVVRIAEDVRVGASELHTLPTRLTAAIVKALKAPTEPKGDLLPDLDFPNPASLQAFVRVRDIASRLEIGNRPPADQVEELFQPFFDLHEAMPGSPQSLVGLVGVLGRLLDPRAAQLAGPAKPYLDQALETFPDSAQLWHLSATWHATFSQPPATDQAEDDLRRAMELDPDYLPARFALAELLRFLGRPDEEDELYKEFEGHETHAVAVLDRFAAVLASRGETEPAREKWMAALTRDPAFTPALRNLSTLNLQQGQPVEARKFLEKAVARPERLPIVLHEYSVQLIAEGDHAKAIPYLQRHLRFNPNHVPSILDLGHCHRALGDHKAAKATYEKVGQMDPQGVAGADARLALFGLDHADDANKLDELTARIWESCDQEALDALSLFLGEHDTLNLWQPLYALGIGQRTLENWEAAQETLEKAQKVCPPQTDVVTALATCHLHFGKLNEAMMLVGPALQARPNDATIMATYGLVNHMAGRLDEAERAYQRAAQLNPEDPSVAQYMEALDRWRQGERVPLI